MQRINVFILSNLRELGNFQVYQIFVYIYGGIFMNDRIPILLRLSPEESDDRDITADKLDRTQGKITYGGI